MDNHEVVGKEQGVETDQRGEWQEVKIDMTHEISNGEKRFFF